MANNKEKTVTLTVAECSEFHNMGECYEGITNVADAIEKFRSIPPERMNGIPAIGVRVTGHDGPGDIVEMDVLIGNHFDLDMLQYVPDLAENWQVQQMIAGLIHNLPNMEIDGEIPKAIQEKIDWINASDKRKDELKQITDRLEKGVTELFQSTKYKEFLNTMSRFPNYSVNNTLLIMMQRPDAQLCQSFTGWKQMGRYVKKGEKGISILAPAPYKIERERVKLDGNGNPVRDKDGEAVTEKSELTIMAFKVVKTFDVSQTDGKELPSTGPGELIGSIEGYPKLLKILQEISPVPVSFEMLDRNTKGFYDLKNKRIVIQDGMSEVQTIKTLLHEMTHQRLHDKDLVPEAKEITRNGKEVEAESVAYVVCQHYGINTSDYSFSYVAGWSEGKETPELKAALDKIRQTASEFITQIDEKAALLTVEKEQTVGKESPGEVKNPGLQGTINSILQDLSMRRSNYKSRTSVKSKIKENAMKSEQEPRKGRSTSRGEERG